MSAQNHNMQFRSLQYDGTNSADVLALAQLKTNVSDWAIQSETGGILTLSFDQSGPDTVSFAEDDWAVFIPNIMQLAAWPPSLYNDYFGLVPAPADFRLSMGYALTPAILGGNSATVAVQISPGQASESYQARAVLTGASSLLSELEITSVSVVDTDTVNVVVHNTGLISLSGATVVVTTLSVG